MTLIQSCDETVVAAQAEQPQVVGDHFELVVNGLGGHLHNFSVSRGDFLSKTEKELQSFLLELSLKAGIINQETKRTSLFLFGDATEPPLAVGETLVVNLIKTAGFIVSEVEGKVLSVEIDDLIIDFDSTINNIHDTTPILPGHDRRGPLTRELFVQSFINGQYKVRAIKWREGVIQVYHPGWTKVPLTMEFIDFVKENIDYLMGKKLELSAEIKTQVTIAFGFFFYKHQGIPAPNDFLGLELEANKFIRLLNTIRLPSDPEIAPDSGIPGIVKWINQR